MTDFQHPHLTPQMLAQRAVQQGSDRALQHVDGSVLCWNEAYQDALHWADALERLGAIAGKPVVTIFSNSFDAYRSWLGCGWLGAIEAPINTNYKGDWLRHVISNTGAEIVLTEARFAQSVFDIADQLSDVKQCVVFGTLDSVPPSSLPFRVLSAEEFLQSAAVRERAEPSPWDISSLIYTSGTTGRSKAVMVPWRQLQSSLDSGMIPRDRLHETGLYSPYPVFHVTGKAGFYYATVYGNPTVIREAFSPADFWADIRTHAPNGTVLLGPLAQMMLDQPAQPNDADNPLRTVVMAPVIADVDAFRSRFNVDVFTTYNMTEINCPIVSSPAACTGANYKSCGTVRDGVEVRIVDEHDIEVPVNTPGEMIVRGEPWELNAGYWNMPEKTSEAWRNGWFHTGDAFTYDENGNYYFVDRAKDYIRRRGENISSFEVESIVNQYPAIAECGAAAVPAEEGEDEVKIAVVLVPDADFDPAELMGFLATRMPRFAIPRFVEIWDGLPKTEATARIQKAKIRESGVTAKTWDRIKAGVKLPR
jgi:crotonobetaine/carnitine-CoA ligase|tara:strand:- start:253 stop:1854 length:1602 start_codon:yes stop_codon:yes gene_type:complete